MSKTATGIRDLGALDVRNRPSAEEIGRQLDSILASPVFHGSKRCHQFLEYVCGKSLAGEMGALKERTIAIEVFGRPPQSDLGEDTIVRVGAREVRKRLAQYYMTPEGAAAEIRIDLPSGAYAPEFRYVSQIHEEDAAAATMAATAPPLTASPAPGAPAVPATDNKRKLPRKVAFACAGLVLIAVAVLAVVEVSAGNPNAELFQRFWAPVLQSPDPLLIAVAHPIVYHPSRRAVIWSEEALPPEPTPAQRAIQVPPNRLNGTDMIPVYDQYVGFGDLVASNEVTGMLARKSKSVRVRMASGVQFEDLRKAQTLLIGATTNRWTMELQQTWRFRFGRSADYWSIITDTQRKGQQWSIPAKDDGSSPEDYILVCRIRNSFTGGFLLVAAGLKQFGTEAAGRLLADPDQLGVILRNLAPGWEWKNLQLVLHARVIGNTPAQPEVVASHVW